MFVDKLVVNNVRNLQNSTVDDFARINIFYGDNGSGKTSYLEAINFVCLARSFRTKNIKKVIKYNNTDLSVYAEIKQSNDRMSIGVQRFLNSDMKIKINQETFQSIVQLAKRNPVKILDNQMFELFFGFPSQRRSFVDWYLFYEQLDFFIVWKKFVNLLKQRNAYLKQCNKNTYNLKEDVWLNLLAEQMQIIHQMRKHYIDSFKNELQQILDILQIEPIDVIINSATTDNYIDLLQKNIDRDIKLGFTTSGIHKDDIKFLTNKQDAQTALSRGQQKLLLFALHFTQAQMLANQNKHCIYLIDDFSSELDINTQKKIINFIKDTKEQFFITTLDSNLWRKEVTKDIHFFEIANGELFHKTCL